MNAYRCLFTFAVVSLLLAAPAAASDSKELLAKIRTGKVVVHSIVNKKSGPKTGRAIAVVDAPPEVVAQIIGEIDRYPEFVPRCTDSRKVDPSRFVVFTRLPWPLKDTWAYIQLERRNQDQMRHLSWKMINGTLRRYEGMAWVQPLGASRSVLTYQMLAVPVAGLAPDSLITRGLRNAVKAMVKAVRKRAAKVMAQRPAPGARVASK